MRGDAPKTPSTPADRKDKPRQKERPKMVVRAAELKDAAAISALSARVYGDKEAHPEKMIRAQINNFPGGQFVAEYMGQIVGHCATFIIGEDLALRQHTWDEITGHGLAARHDPDGDYLYGMEVSVHPDFRRLRVGQRLYDARRALCQEYGLKGIVFGGRMPGYARQARQFPDPLVYAQGVAEKQVKDNVISFHLANGFELLGVLRNYLPSDKPSGGHATHMIWHNPLHHEAGTAAEPRTGLQPKDVIRVAAVQFQMRRISSIDEFERQVEYFVDVASDYRCDFVTFPELFTLELLSLEKEPLPPAKGIVQIAEYTERFLAFMERLSVRYNINIIGGSHPTRTSDGEIRNIAYVFLRDGSVHTQEKIHPTPSEAYWWNIKGGNKAEAINTDCGPIGVLICYDSEFPELARHMVDQGAQILFVPFCTDERRAFMRVRICAHARAIENQCYAVLAGVVGNLPNVENMDIHYAESAILTPCDFAFARDGVAADAAANTETIAFADLRLSDLRTARTAGAVRNLKDRRFDLYQLVWNRQNP
jgi:predicted amidohydrolase/ribosomal protein S18 acetylase RimI-like enzyme